MGFYMLIYKWIIDCVLVSGGQDLMRELEEKEEAIKSVQDKAEGLMLEQHPARPTIEVGPCRVLLLPTGCGCAATAASTTPIFTTPTAPLRVF